MFVAHLLAWSVEDEVLPVANAWHELDAKDVSEAEDWRALTMGIGVHRVGLDVALVLIERVEDVRAFIGATWDEVAEQGDVKVGNVVVADPAKTAIADVVFRKQVPFVQVPFGSVCRDVLA